MINLIHGDCLEVMKSLDSESVDAVVTDPPYGLSSHSQQDIVNALTAWLAGEDYHHGKKGFMGKEWDSFVPSPILWRECFRVLKPGAHILCAAGTRTVDLMGISLRLAGFEIRDTIEWIYGSGFPKSLDISKDIDRKLGVEREVIGINPYYSRNPNPRKIKGQNRNYGTDNRVGVDMKITAPSTDQAKKFKGIGTALKPAHEPFILARKPIEKGLSVAENCLKYGTGGIDIDGCRVPMENESIERKSSLGKLTNVHMEMRPWMQKRHEQGIPLKQNFINTIGRFPANVTHDGSDCVVNLFPKSETCDHRLCRIQGTADYAWGSKSKPSLITPAYQDKGSAARFFYCAKASPSEREYGLNGDKRDAGSLKGNMDGYLNKGYGIPKKINHHPTVKPIKLLEYLVKLISRENQVVLDPFMGSGTTGIACRNLNRQFIGIEIDAGYYDIAYQRIHQESQPLAKEEEQITKDKPDAVEVIYPKQSCLF